MTLRLIMPLFDQIVIRTIEPQELKPPFEYFCVRFLLLDLDLRGGEGTESVGKVCLQVMCGNSILL